MELASAWLAVVAAAPAMSLATSSTASTRAWAYLARAEVRVGGRVLWFRVRVRAKAGRGGGGGLAERSSLARVRVRVQPWLG